ncbi:MAG TPA: PIG-L deacetylase family protein [Candidatus Limnocylindria bacterium]|nr:PIG-L deacetylase family protein [Candidatus Limnocylindria bacterium]
MPERFVLPRRAMAVFAHPDDVDFGCSGTLSQWADAGVHITYCLLTSGQKGTHDPDMDPEALARTREREQRAAGKVVGAKELVFLRHQDGELVRSQSLVGEVTRVIREHKPNLLITQDPWRAYQMHPDHRVAGWTGLDALIAARDHLFFRDQLTNGLTHHRISRLMLFGTSEPNVWSDITPTIDRKIRAITSHRSQVRDRKALSERMRGFAAATGRAWGIAYAEAFRYFEL